MRVALVHDVLNQLGGAERVLENFLEIWPDAVIHTVFYDERKTEGRFAKYAKKVSFLNGMPLAHRHPKLFLALLPWAFGRFRFDDFDLVLSDSSAFAKFAKARGKMHVCYCHTPTRFLWTEPEYLDKQPYPFWMRWAGRLVLPIIRKMDYAAAQKIDFIIANSQNVSERIKKYYSRDARVIWPPVDTAAFHPDGPKQDYFLVAGRLEPYKRIDLVIEAFNKLGLPLKVAGSGSALGKLRSMAKPNIEFLGRVSDEDLNRLYSGAKAFIFPTEEDAGIMPLEAMACGTPVIAYGKGGALETVKPGVTGEWLLDQSADSLVAAVKDFNPSKYDPQTIRNHAMNFDKQVFQQKIREFVESKLPRRIA